MPYVGHEMLTLSGTPDFTLFGELIIYTYIICQSKDYVYGLITDLFAWVSLAAFVVDLFYSPINKPKCSDNRTNLHVLLSRFSPVNGIFIECCQSM